jgi:hypothetical protein
VLTVTRTESKSINAGFPGAANQRRAPSSRSRGMAGMVRARGINGVYAEFAPPIALALAPRGNRLGLRLVCLHGRGATSTRRRDAFEEIQRAGQAVASVCRGFQRALPPPVRGTSAAFCRAAEPRSRPHLCTDALGRRVSSCAIPASGAPTSIPVGAFPRRSIKGVRDGRPV